jgi:hypothetical protein
MTSAHRRIYHHRLARREQTIMPLLLSLLLASCAHTPREARSPSEVTLDPLSLRIPFGIDLLEEGIDPRWKELREITQRHSEAFGLHREYDPSSTLAACRSSLFEDLPHDTCLRFTASGQGLDPPFDPGAISILIVRQEDRSLGQLRVISFGNPWRGDIYPRNDEEREANFYLGARTVLDTLAYLDSDHAARIINSAMKRCRSYEPLAIDDDRADGPENWSLEARVDGTTCHGVQRRALGYNEIWGDSSWSASSSSDTRLRRSTRCSFVV